MTIEHKIGEIQANLALFDDAMSKYEYIIELGKAFKPLDVKYHTPEYKVQGCQSSVWMKLAYENETLTIEADSDAFIVKGLVAIISTIYEGSSCEEINHTPRSLLEQLGLEEIITQGRQNGVASMIKKIYDFCQART